MKIRKCEIGETKYDHEGRGRMQQKIVFTEAGIRSREGIYRLSSIYM